jgi:hypothetical protein
VEKGMKTEQALHKLLIGYYYYYSLVEARELVSTMRSGLVEM